MASPIPDTNRGLRAAIGPLRDDITRGVQDSLLALLGASGLIVLITCVNVANLLLVRAIARRHETSVRFALGASRFRIVRQFLAESVIVSAGGCAAGILLGKAMLRILLAMAPRSIPRLESVAMDWQIFAVAALDRDRHRNRVRHRARLAGIQHQSRRCPQNRQPQYRQ